MHIRHIVHAFLRFFMIVLILSAVIIPFLQTTKTAQAANTPSLVLDNNVLTFSYQAGTATPAAQTIHLTSSDNTTPLNFSATSNASWLTVSPTSGTTPGALTVSVNPAGLAANTYTGIITVNSTNAGNSSLSVLVNFVVESNGGPTLGISPNSILYFTYKLGSAAPASQIINLASSNASTPLNFSATSNQPWLTVTPTTGNTPGALTVSVNPNGLASGKYDGSLTFNSTNAGNASPASMGVILTVTGKPNLVADNNVLTFSYQAGTATPAAQTIHLTSSDNTTPLSFTATSNQPWLTVTPTTGNTPGTLTVSVNPAGLAANTYTGIITVNSTNAGNSSLSVLVNFVVANTPALVANTTVLTFDSQVNGSAPAAQTIHLTSSDNTTPLNFSATSNASWLTVSPTSGTTPGALTVSVNPAGLAANTYTGIITVNSTNASNSPISILVNFVTANTPSLVLDNNVLTFSYQAGTATPAAQTIHLTSSDNTTPLNFSATSNASWLTVSPTSGTTPGALTVSVNPAGLAANTYTGIITVNSTNAGNSSLSVLVNFVVANTPTIVADNNVLTFSYQAGTATPAAQTIHLTSSDNTTPLNFSATSNQPWLTVTPTTGNTPGTLTVSVNPNGLTANTYTGIITVNSNLSILVNFVVQGGVVFPANVQIGNVVQFVDNITAYLVEPDGLHGFTEYAGYKTYITTAKQTLIYLSVNSAGVTISPESAETFLANSTNTTNTLTPSTQEIAPPTPNPIVTNPIITNPIITPPVITPTTGPVTAPLLTVPTYTNNTLINDKGTIYLIESNTKIPFSSMSAFTGLGYSLKNVQAGSTAQYSLAAGGYALSSANQEHPWGSWVQDGSTVYFVSPTGYIGVPTLAILNQATNNTNVVVPASAGDIKQINSSQNVTPLTTDDSRLQF